MAPIDQFNDQTNLESPAYNAVPVTPSDTTDLTYMTRGLYIGVAGDVTVNMLNGTSATNIGTVTFTAVPAGTILPIACWRVKSSGTTATNITALW